MKWVVGHRLELCFVVIYMRNWSVVDSFQWNVESTSELDYERANTPMGPNGPHFKLIFLYDTVYKG